jgi:glycosyltransferase involved in cell wall biosynthesis
MFLRWWQPFLESVAPIWHATTHEEGKEIRDYWQNAEIVVVSDHVGFQWAERAGTGPHPGPVRLVFIGRISRKKNLALVLEALRLVTRPVDLEIFGPLEDARYWGQCQSLIRRLPAHISVAYRGALVAAEVRATFARYDAFIFATLGENFGYVIAESLSASCPVICSDRTPWTGVLLGGGGSVVKELSAAAWAGELERVANMSPTERSGARQAAGAAFRAWRIGQDSTNILDRVLSGD